MTISGWCPGIEPKSIPEHANDFTWEVLTLISHGALKAHALCQDDIDMPEWQVKLSATFRAEPLHMQPQNIGLAQGPCVAWTEDWKSSGGTRPKDMATILNDKMKC